MQRKITDKIKDIQTDILKVKDTELKQHLKKELTTLEGLVQEGIRREFSYFKHISLTITGATGVILFWRGIYELSSQNPILGDPNLCLVSGLIILALTGVLTKEFITVPARAQ